MKPWTVMVLALALTAPGLVITLPTLAVAQAKDARTLSPAEVRELRAQLGDARSQLGRTRVQRDVALNSIAIERRSAVTARADLRRVAQIFGFPDGTPTADIAAQLQRWAEQDQENREELVRLGVIVERIENGEVRDAAEHYLSEAQTEFEDGRLEDADRTLAQLETLRRSAQTEAKQLWRASVLMRSGLARQQGNFERADAIPLEAERISDREARRDRFTFRSDRALTASLKGEWLGDSAALEQAIRLYSECLSLLDRVEDADDWAATQNRLGYVLVTLGERESGTERLTMAVQAFEAALPIYTRAASPQQWAMIQNNLGQAYWRIGQREGGTAQLDAAIAAYEAALEENTRERNPTSWAAIQDNLGNVYMALAASESGTARIDQAITAYHAALEIRTRAQDPLQWAKTQNNLGNAYWSLGLIGSGTADLQRAVAAYRASLEVNTRERLPLQWAMTQANLGNALEALGRRGSDTTSLEQAISAYQAALVELTRERFPRHWAMAMNNLGTALQSLGELERGTARLEQAVTAYEASLQEHARRRDAPEWARTQVNLSASLEIIAERSEGREALARLQASRDDLLNAVRILEGAGWIGQVDFARRLLARIDSSTWS